MAFNRNSGFKGKSYGGRYGKKKSNFTRIGNLFKSKHPKEGMQFQYYTSVEGKYLEAVVDAINKHANDTGSVSFSLVKYTDAEYPVLSVAAGKPKDSKPIRKAKNDSFHAEPEQDESEEQEEVGL